MRALLDALGERLADATANAAHEFWADDVSLLDPGVVDPGRVHGPAQLTAIPLNAVPGAQKKHLLVL